MCIFTSPLSSPTLNAHPTSYIPHPLLYRALTLVPLQAVTPSHCTIVALSLYLTPLCCPVAHRFVPSHCDAALLEPLRLGKKVQPLCGFRVVLTFANMSSLLCAIYDFVQPKRFDLFVVVSYVRLFFIVSHIFLFVSTFSFSAL
ncbi:hypothetical protein AAZV13_19G062100 [Glycine max]